MPTTLHDIRPI
ncbi:hypothetical protein YPPY64_2008, partial [Yersinia pestis PY-64]